jgi:hypothetical protein
MELSTILIGTVMATLPLLGAGLLTAMVVLERPYPAGLAEHPSIPARNRTRRRQSAVKRGQRA